MLHRCLSSKQLPLGLPPRVPGTLVKSIILIPTLDNPDIVPESVYESCSALAVVEGVAPVPEEVVRIQLEALALDVVGVKADPNMLVGVPTVALTLEFVSVNPVVVHVLGMVGDELDRLMHTGGC